VDINHDGLKDLICGKRCWAHGPSGDPEPNAPLVLYWFELKREGTKATFIPHLINANSGVGTQVMAVDTDGDGKLACRCRQSKGSLVTAHESQRSGALIKPLLPPITVLSPSPAALFHPSL